MIPKTYFIRDNQLLVSGLPFFDDDDCTEVPNEPFTESLTIVDCNFGRSRADLILRRASDERKFSFPLHRLDDLLDLGIGQHRNMLVNTVYGTFVVIKHGAYYTLKVIE